MEPVNSLFLLPPVPSLSLRETELLHHLLQGHRSDVMARELGLSTFTVCTYLSRLYKKLGVKSRLEAGIWATQHPDLLS